LEDEFEEPFMNHQLTKWSFFCGALNMAFSIILGAMLAHYLESVISARQMQTFETGNRYHMIHSMAFFLLGLFQINFKINIKVLFIILWLGIILFSLNCYLYAVTEIKLFAILVPLGGMSFIFFWVFLAYKFFIIIREK
jgi:uncharacterized membrane protein YgdD (TMEM256/DUF423 family)